MELSSNLVRIFIFNFNFHTIILEKRMKMVVFQVLSRQAGIHRLIFYIFIRPSWSGLWVRESLSQENYLLFWLEKDNISKSSMTWLHIMSPLARKGLHWRSRTLGHPDCESLTQNFFYPKADLIFKVEMNQKEDHFHIVLLTTPFSYTTDVSDG